MSVSSKLARVQWLFKWHGIRGFFTYLIRFLIWPDSAGKSRRMFLFVLDKPRPSQASIKAAEGHTFRFATLEDLQTLQQEPAWDIQATDITAFEKGDLCLLQLDGEKLVGYAWLAASPLVEIMWGFHFNMPDDTAYNYKGFTNPAYRGKGFQPLRHLKLLEHIKQDGQDRLFGFVDQFNLNSLKGVRKSGYKKIGVLRYLMKNGNVNFKLKVNESGWYKHRRT
jgi:hypothetical protein